MTGEGIFHTRPVYHEAVPSVVWATHGMTKSAFGEKIVCVHLLGILHNRAAVHTPAPLDCGLVVHHNK